MVETPILCHEILGSCSSKMENNAHIIILTIHFHIGIFDLGFWSERRNVSVRRWFPTDMQVLYQNYRTVSSLEFTFSFLFGVCVALLIWNFLFSVMSKANEKWVYSKLFGTPISKLLKTRRLLKVRFCLNIIHRFSSR